MIQKAILIFLTTLSLCSQEAVQPVKSVAQNFQKPLSGKPNPLLDHDLLDPAYFGIDGSLMKENKVADFFWVKPGFSFKGHTLKVDWEAPHLLVPHDEKVDLDAAAYFSKLLPQELLKCFAASLWPAAKVSSAEGDLILTGRIVMINAKSRFSFSKEILTFDLKIMNAATKEVVLASHHRLIPNPGLWNMKQRVPAYAFELSEFCLANYTK